MSGSNGMADIRERYGVPAARGRRVIHDGCESGVITSSDGAHIRVRFDGERRSASCHPLSLDYGDGVVPAKRLAQRNARIDIWNDRLNGRITQQEYAMRWAAA